MEVWKGRGDRIGWREELKALKKGLRLKGAFWMGVPWLKKEISSCATLNKPVQKKCAKFLKENKNNMVIYKTKNGKKKHTHTHMD